ncbi:hypothetical protein XENOCAPTIV_005382, partial [Xenoophorus captivus]
FKKGFESEPTLHSGINYAVLLLAAEHQFDTSFELRKVGEAFLSSACCKSNSSQCCFDLECWSRLKKMSPLFDFL